MPKTKLANWEDVRPQAFPTKHARPSILLGNGISVNVWPDFSYASLKDHALNGGELLESDLGVFEEFGTNFERILSSLLVTERALRAMGRKKAAAAARELYLRVQNALVKAVKDVHLRWSDDQDFQDVLTEIGGELRRYNRVYTTNYDVLVYWSILHVNEYENRDVFKDAFFSNRSGDDTVEFNIADAKVSKSASLVLYPHGALHLVRASDGSTHKLCRREGSRLLERFGETVLDDAVPLVVTEGSSERKRESIAQTEYLAYCREEMGNDDQPLVIMGHSLSAEDAHLLEAISDRPDFRKRAFLIGIYPPAGDIDDQVSHFLQLFAGTVHTVAFFDSRTHPLGDPELRLPATP